MEHHLKEIIVGYDFSEASQAAVRAAIFFARKVGSHVRIVTALPGAIDPDVVRALEKQTPGASKLDRVADMLDKVEKMIRVDLQPFYSESTTPLFEVSRKSPVPAILHLSKEQHGDMIIVGSVGSRGTYAGWKVGIDAQRLARRSMFPVLITNPKREFPPKKILSAVDFSAASERAFGWALDLARMSDHAHLTALHVMERESPLFGKLSGINEETYYAVEAETAQNKLDEFMGQHRLDVEVEAKLRRGISDEQILLELQEGEYDLLAIGTLGRNAIIENLIGGTAERVIRGAPCSVLAIKPDEFAVQTGLKGGAGVMSSTGLAR